MAELSSSFSNRAESLSPMLLSGVENSYAGGPAIDDRFFSQLITFGGIGFGFWPPC